MQVPKRKPGKFALEPADDFLSPDAIRRLNEELTRLETRSRPKAVQDLRQAREMGDLSENAAYTEAKARLGGIDGRLFTIKERLKHAVVIEAGAGSDGSVRLGATVRLEINGREKTFTLTGAQEADPGAGRISYHSPLGSALMGKKPGETVMVRLSGREISCRIIAVG